MGVFLEELKENLKSGAVQRPQKVATTSLSSLSGTGKAEKRNDLTSKKMAFGNIPDAFNFGGCGREGGAMGQ